MTPAARGHRADDDLVRLYLHDIGRHPLLTREDEIRLGQAMEAGSMARIVLANGARLPPACRRMLARDVQYGGEAERTLVQSNLRLVVHVAKRYHPSALPFLDLVQEGNLGLLRAVERFDWHRGFRFSTGATWSIHQAISRGLDNSGRTIRLPVHVAQFVATVRVTEMQLAARQGHFPTPAEIATELGITEGRVEDALRVRVPPRSLSEPLGEDGTGELGDLVVDRRASSPVDAVVDEFRTTAVADLLVQLNPREREVIRLRFGLDRDAPMTLAEIGRHFNLTRERIRQIEADALAKLRRPSNATAVRDLLAS